VARWLASEWRTNERWPITPRAPAAQARPSPGRPRAAFARCCGPTCNHCATNDLIVRRDVQRNALASANRRKNRSPLTWNALCTPGRRGSREPPQQGSTPWQTKLQFNEVTVAEARKPWRHEIWIRSGS
jgi:hypothetical protein